MFQTLRAKTLIIVAGIVLVTTMTITFFVQRETVSRFYLAHEENARNLLNTVYLNVENQYESIEFHKVEALKIRKEELRNIIAISLNTIDTFYNEYKEGRMSKKEAQRLSLRELKSLRYDEGVGYIWINDTGRPIPRMIMHPTIPELDGTILDSPRFNCAQGIKKNLFQAFVDVCLESGAGYVDYDWPKPTKDGLTTEKPKISFVSLFKPWNWILGTGLYIDDIEEYGEHRLRAVISELRHAFQKASKTQDGYMFLFTGKKEMLIHRNREGEDFENLITPSTGKPILEELMEASRSPHKSLKYLWEIPSGVTGDFSHWKRAYVRYFKPLDWYICSTFYDREIEKPALGIRNKIYLLSGIFLLAALGLALLFSRSLTKPLHKLNIAAQQIEERGVPNARIPIIGTSETQKLGTVLNNMLDSINETETALRVERDLNKEANDIINMSPAVVFLWKNAPGWPVELVSENVKDVFGYTVNDFIEGKLSYASIIFSEDKERVMEEVNHFSHGKSAQNFIHQPYRIITKEGKIKWLDDRTHLRRDKNGNITHYQGVVLDITERKEAEEELNSLRNYLKNIIDSMPSILVGVDLQGRVTQWNREAEKATGLSADEARSRKLDRISTSWPLELEKIQQAIKERRPIVEEKVPGGVTKGTTFSDVTIYPLVANHAQGAVIRIDDVSKRIKIEEMMVQTEKMMSVGGLAAGMAHEINNPLGIILQSIQNTHRRISPKFEKNLVVAEECGVNLENVNQYLEKRNILRYLEGMKEAGQRAARIVTNMLNFSRRSESKASWSNINLLVDETLELVTNDYDLKKRYDFRRVEINRQYDLRLPEIPCVRTEIEQVLLNLIKNAAHAMSEIKNEDYKPEITIKTADADDYVLIEVIDNGPGMNENTRKRVFEPFFTTKPVGIGTGLGLSVSYFIITTNHMGKMSVDKTPEGGTVFRIWLPYQREISPQETSRR
jgi:PAS domain S-box-containing protein